MDSSRRRGRLRTRTWSSPEATAGSMKEDSHERKEESAKDEAGDGEAASHEQIAVGSFARSAKRLGHPRYDYPGSTGAWKAPDPSRGRREGQARVEAGCRSPKTFRARKKAGCRQAPTASVGVQEPQRRRYKKRPEPFGSGLRKTLAEEERFLSNFKEPARRPSCVRASRRYPSAGAPVSLRRYSRAAASSGESGTSSGSGSGSGTSVRSLTLR